VAILSRNESLFVCALTDTFVVTSKVYGLIICLFKAYGIPEQVSLFFFAIGRIAAMDAFDKTG